MAKFQFSGGGGEFEVNVGHLKSEVFHFGGRGAFSSEIPERSFLENLDKNLLFSQKPACASQIVSHILRMWRLIKPAVCWLQWNHRHRRKTHHHFLLPDCALAVLSSMSTCDSMQAAINSHLHGKKQPHSVVTCEKIFKINRFISFMIIPSIIIFNNKHNGYYPLIDFYLNSLFTVNYN